MLHCSATAAKAFANVLVWTPVDYSRLWKRPGVWAAGWAHLRTAAGAEGCGTACSRVWLARAHHTRADEIALAADLPAFHQELSTPVLGFTFKLMMLAFPTLHGLVPTSLRLSDLFEWHRPIRQLRSAANPVFREPAANLGHGGRRYLSLRLSRWPGMNCRWNWRTPATTLSTFKCLLKTRLSRQVFDLLFCQKAVSLHLTLK